MATDECAGTIADRVRPGPDRLVLQMPSNVVCELRRRLVAARGLDIEGSQKDVVQVAGELAREARVTDRGARSHNRALESSFDRARRQILEAAWVDASEQLVKHCAERVDVRRGVRCFPPDLLGAGIVRRQRRSNRVVGGSDTLDEQLADAEVEELGHASGINQDVAWLQVAMDDEVAMRVIDRRADSQEQSQPGLDSQ